LNRQLKKQLKIFSLDEQLKVVFFIKVKVCFVSFRLKYIRYDVESQSDVEETVTVVKKTTTCEICGVAFKGIKIHLAACKKKTEIKRIALLALFEQAENST
jgi:hypothetical protein